MPAASRAAAIALLGIAVVPLAITEPMTRWNSLAAMAPFEAVVAAAMAWIVAGAVREGRLPTSYAAGMLVSVGVLGAAGSLALITFSVTWVRGIAVLFSVAALLGALTALGAGVGCLRASPSPPDSTPTERSMIALAGLGTVLATAALFVPYDKHSSLWTEVREGTSAVYAYLPVAAAILLVVAVFLLTSRRRFAAAVLFSTGTLAAVHLVGVLLAASFAIGEAGEVREAWILGVAGGGLAALAGWLVHRTAA